MIKQNLDSVSLYFFTTIAERKPQLFEPHQSIGSTGEVSLS